MATEAPKKSKKVFASRPVPLNLSPELLGRVEKLAGRIGEPKSTVMRMALKLGLDMLEKGMGQAG